jgi:hypothetical protein
MKTRIHRFVALTWLVIPSALFGANCVSDPDPSSSGPGANVSLQSRADGFCDQNKGQFINPYGFCVCDAEGTRFDKSSGECVQCTANCDGKQCGGDGCQGNCGTCPEGQTCNDSGTCMACEAQCSGKVCGDDQCNGSCGSCAANETCDQGQCRANDSGPKVVTSCNCNVPAPGAYPGAYRVESSCPMGVAQFELCDDYCAYGGQQWQELCADGLACGTVVQPCTCAFIAASPGQLVTASMCSSGVAQLQLCNYFCGGGYAWGAVCWCG